jgi:hypothetical protein
MYHHPPYVVKLHMLQKLSAFDKSTGCSETTASRAAMTKPLSRRRYPGAAAARHFQMALVGDESENLVDRAADDRAAFFLNHGRISFHHGLWL